VSHPTSALSQTDRIVGEAITHLLEKGFQPKRTLILSHGFDEEEVFARRGQGHIAPFLEERYGNDGLLMVIDEGFGTSDNVSRLAG
jgi:Gly-Xaa carboxypeptidase